MEKAIIMDIQRYSIHDGPGIRSTVFFKGCHMSCRWCHNPESQQSRPEMLFYDDLCVGCGACKAFCKWGAVTTKDGKRRIDLSFCRDCERKAECAESCPAQALRLCGQEMTVNQVLEQVLRDKAFYGAPEEEILSRGGVTCSGGEPLLQADFLAELLKRCREEGIGTCIDTTLNVDWSQIEKALPYTDLFLVDLKFMDDRLAQEYTGADCSMVHSNLKRLSRLEKPVILRIPLVPGVNDTAPENTARETFLKELNNVLRVDRFPVTDHAAKKYRALQREDWLALRRKS